MPRRPSLEPSRSNLTKHRPWKVELPARLAPGGKRRRFFFKTRQEALSFRDVQRIRLENFGVKGSAILAPSEQEQAENAIAVLNPYNVSLNEVIHDWIARQRAASASISFETAMDAFLEIGRRSESHVRSSSEPADWAGGLLKKRPVLKSGETYRLVLSAPAGDPYEVYPLESGKQYGFDTPNLFADGHFGALGDSTWRENRKDFQMQFYFVTSASPSR